MIASTLVFAEFEKITAKMIRRLLIVYFYLIIPFLLLGCVFLMIVVVKYLNKNLKLSDKCENCINDERILKKTEKGTRYIEFSYNNNDYIAETTYSFQDDYKYDGKKVSFYFSKENPSFNRINIDLEKKGLSNTIIVLFFLILITTFIIWLTLHLKKTSLSNHPV